LFYVFADIYAVYIVSALLACKCNYIIINFTAFA